MGKVSFLYMLAINYPQASVDTPEICRDVFPSNYEEMFVFPRLGKDFISSAENENADEFQSEIDGPPLVRTFRNFTVQAGHIVRPSNRCKGLYLNILGDLNLAGTISMTARGAKGQGKFIGVFPDYDTIFYCSNSADYNIVDPSVSKLIIGAVGGAGGARATMATHSSPGGAGINNAGGGGGSGAAGANISEKSNNGTAGTSFSGGSGGGGIVVSGGTNQTCHAEAYAGIGGRGLKSGTNYTSSAGVGNPSGTVTGGALTSPSGTGGAIILVVRGNLIISATGRLAAEGIASTNATNFGGGSGGGLIHVFCYGEIDNKGTISVAGGARGGGAGSKTVWQKVNGVWQRLTV